MNASPVLIPEHVEAAFQAYEDIGIRALVGITLFDRPFFRAMPFVDEEFPPELLRSLDGKPNSSPDEYLEFARHLARTRHPRRTASATSPRRRRRSAAPKIFCGRCARWPTTSTCRSSCTCRRRGLQVVTGQLFYGSPMVEYLERVGFLSRRRRSSIACG